MSDLHFDPHQFAHYSQPVAAEFTQSGWTSTGVAFEDLVRMDVKRSSVPLRHPRWIPAFAASDEKLRRALMKKAWSYLHHGAKEQPPDDWKVINDAATKRALSSGASFKNCPAYKRCESEAHVAAVQHAGGYLALLAAIAYDAWRLRLDSVAIAGARHISPQSVRVHLQRICNCARSLGYETFPRHHSFGRKRPVKQARRKDVPA